MALVMVRPVCVRVYAALEYRIRPALRTQQETFPDQQGPPGQTPTWSASIFDAARARHPSYGITRRSLSSYSGSWGPPTKPGIHEIVQSYAECRLLATQRTAQEHWLLRVERPRAGAQGALRAWGKRGRQSGRAKFERLLGTSKRWRGEITTDCLGRQTSGFVEGFNTRVQVLKRRYYGIFTVGRLVQRRTLDVHGYQRFGPT
jgi:hypothetical protein